MGEPRLRPDIKEIKDAFDNLFNSRAKLAKLKDAALGGRLFRGLDNSAGVVGRSMAWKLFLIASEPLQDSVDVEAVAPLQSLSTAREDYRKLLMEKMRAPDGGYEEGFTVPGSGVSPQRTTHSNGNLDKNNPLSLDDENPWREWFAAVDLRKTILQDVERTVIQPCFNVNYYSIEAESVRFGRLNQLKKTYSFPDIAYFRDADVQAELTNILYLYSDMHPDTGYRQGMHELLAPLFYAVDYDSITEEPDMDATLKEFCARSWVAADAWLLFTAVMKGAGRWYEWQESKSRADTSPLPSHVQLNIGDTSLKPYVAPIVEACNRLQSVFLKAVDPELWKAMQGAGIEPQIYGIRWLRLLFTREFSMEDAMAIWDALFAVELSWDLPLWICVAMLVRIRNKLIPADYSAQLTCLLRYPASLAAAGGDEDHNVDLYATLLVRQALTLQMSPTPTTGVSIINQNKNLLGISMDVPPPVSPPVRRRPRTGERGRSFTGSNESGETSKAGHGRVASSPMGLPETFARGLLERGESLGINKTVMNAMSELKKINLPDIATALGRLPLSPPSANAMYSMTSDRPVGERPPWEPRTRLEVEHEAAQVRTLHRKLGDSVGWIVDTLLLDEDDRKDDGAKKLVQERKREALECLAYVRDVLKGGVTELEEERLIGEEELRRRRDKERREKEAAEALSRRTSTPHPPLPAPAAIPIEARPQRLGVRPSQDYFAARSSQSIPPVKTAPVAAPSQTARPPPLSSLPPSASLPAPLSQPIQSQTVKSPTSNASVFNAPWNHTRSSFSSSDSPIATLPRVPPRMSMALPRSNPLPQSFRGPPPLSAVASEIPVVSRDQKPKQAPYDPLGAIP